MTSVFPSSIASFTNPQATDRLNSPSHSAQHTSENDNIVAIETKLGVDGSADTTSIDYILKSPLSTGGGHIQGAAYGGTGQTTYTKGDILIGQSASVLTKLAAPSTNGLVLTSDNSQAVGIRWGVGGNPTVRTYASVASIWNRPSSLSYVVVQVQANGGNGAAGVDGGANDTAGGGGGGGGFAQKVIPAASLPIAVSVLSQAGGAGSILSYFGSLLSAVGGQNGSGSGGAPGGFGVGGDLNMYGQAGGTAGGTGTGNTNGGTGGASHFGGGGFGGGDSTTGGVGGQYGGGGGGGGGEGSQAGGAGAGGIVVVYEY